MQHLPVSQYEIVGLNVSVNNLTVVHLLNHAEHSDREGQDQSLWHHFFWGVFIEVNSILERTQKGILNWSPRTEELSSQELCSHPSPTTPREAPTTEGTCQAPANDGLQAPVHIIMMNTLTSNVP